MTKSKNIQSVDIANYIGVEHEGVNVELKGVSSTDNPKTNTLMWSKKDNSSMLRELSAKGPVFSIVPKQVKVEGFSGINVEDPRAAFSACLDRFFAQKNEHKISKSCVISSGVEIGSNVNIGDNTMVDGNIKIESDVYIGDNVTILGSGIIGHKTEVLSGARIGVESLACVNVDSVNKLIPQLGGFDIGSNCRIGANSIVARGTIDNTTIDNNVMVGEFVVVGHNSQIGQGVVITAGATICGSVFLSPGVWVGPSVTILQGVKVGASIKLGAGAVLLKNISRVGTYLGNPAKKVFD